MKRRSTGLRASGALTTVLVLASTAFAPSARAEAPSMKTVTVSLASRVKALREVATTLGKVGKQPDPANLTEEQQKAAKAYAAWLLAAAQRCDALAREMQTVLSKRDPAATPEQIESVSMQYLALQSALQDENRKYTAVSNIMKSKHDTVKNSIDNLR